MGRDQNTLYEQLTGGTLPSAEAARQAARRAEAGEERLRRERYEPPRKHEPARVVGGTARELCRERAQLRVVERSVRESHS